MGGKSYVTHCTGETYCRTDGPPLLPPQGGERGFVSECRELLEYARLRLEHCPFGERKGTCRVCPVHCYRRDMRERMRRVMRYAGPRMLWYHPVAAVCHVWREFFAR